MKIIGSSVDLAAQHSAYSLDENKSSLTMWKDTANGRQTLTAKTGSISALVQSDWSVARGVSVEISQQARQKLEHDKEELQKKVRDMQKDNVIKKSQTNNDDLNTDGLTAKEKTIIGLLEEFIKSTTGRSVKLNVMDKLGISDESAEVSIDNLRLGRTGQANGQQGWGVIYSESNHHEESEQLSFAAQGKVKTADGREIAFDMGFAMQRSESIDESFEFRAGDALKDPLVINFAADTASLSQQSYSLDIDNDGKMDSIKWAGNGSGFLMLDKDNNGIVSDGSELFGAKTGDGFAELAKLDGDNNGWIDENDAVFSQLKVATKNSNGQEELMSLKQAGVGAIYLGNAKGDFSLKSGYELQGKIRSNGIFLKENGVAGTVQQVDLAY